MTVSSIHRRTVLHGFGAGLALPLLDIMHDRSTAAAVDAGSSNAGAPVRMACIFFANGAIMDQWRPTGEGRDFQLNETMKPLAGHKDKILVASGLTQHHARANGDGGGDHARNASAFLTGAQPRKTSGADISVGVSVDQAAAAKVGHLTRLPSIELGIERGRNAGSCDSGYSCAYSANTSWKSPSTPTAKEVNPRLAFERIFGSKEAAEVQERRNKYRRSILDFVADDARRLQHTLGGTDRQKLDEYFTSLRDIEKRLDRANHLAPSEIPELDLPDGSPAELREHIRLMYDIMVLAYQTDSTRISSFMLANAGSNRTYPEVEVRNGHHELSHHRKAEAKMEQIARVDKFMVEQFAYFLDKLDAVKEGEGTLLDNSMILYGSAISDANRHQHDDLPIILAGRGGGTIDSGRYLKSPNETPLNNLFLAMTDRMNAGIKGLGDSTEPLKIG